MIERLAERVNGDAALVRRGRFVSTVFLIEAGDRQWLISIDKGRVTDVRAGPFVMPSWTFALRAPDDAWSKFWSRDPPPGYHDLFGLLKKRLLKAEGDLHPFMANLLFFKAVLGALRETGA